MRPLSRCAKVSLQVDDIVPCQITLCQMPNAVNDYLVVADFENRPVCCYIAKPVMKFSYDDVEGIVLSCYAAPLRVVGQGSKFPLESIEPAKCLIHRSVFALPERLLQELALCPRHDGHVVRHGLGPNC